MNIDQSYEKVTMENCKLSFASVSFMDMHVNYSQFNRPKRNLQSR